MKIKNERVSTVINFSFFIIHYEKILSDTGAL